MRALRLAGGCSERSYVTSPDFGMSNGGVYRGFGLLLGFFVCHSDIAGIAGVC